MQCSFQYKRCYSILSVFTLAASVAVFSCAPATAEEQPQAPDSEHTAAAKRLMKAFGMEDAFGQLTTLMMQQMELGLKARAETDPRMTPEKKKEFLAKVEQLKVLLPKRIDFSKILTDVTTETFATCFAVKELNEMSAFYENPAGQKFAREFSKNYQESFQLIMKGIEPKIGAAFEQAAVEVLGPPPKPDNAAKPPAPAAKKPGTAPPKPGTPNKK